MCGDSRKNQTAASLDSSGTWENADICLKTAVSWEPCKIGFAKEGLLKFP